MYLYKDLPIGDFRMSTGRVAFNFSLLQACTSNLSALSLHKEYIHVT